MNINQSSNASYVRPFCRSALTLLFAGLCQIATTASTALMEHPTNATIAPINTNGIVSRTSSEDGQPHHLNVVANPTIAGSVSVSSCDLKSGEQVDLSTSNNKQ